MKKYINRNFFWADLFVNQISKLGVKHVCISPGSRNTPLTLAFAQNKAIKKTIHVDERSGAFFALGIAKETKKPVVLLTTSGTAVAELYPAIIEAYNQRVPLIVCTADRPDWLRNTGANQTIYQENIFGNHIRLFYDVGLPSLSQSKLKSLIKKTIAVFKIASTENPGPVHLNFPFKKPLEPTAFTENIDLDIKEFLLEIEGEVKLNEKNKINKVVLEIEKSQKPLIHCSWENIENDYLKEIVKFSKKNNIPILADGTSSLRFLKGNAQIISNHTSFITETNEHPDLIIQFGNAPTSQKMLKYFEQIKTRRILINKFGDVKDPSRNKGDLYKLDPNNFINELNNRSLDSGKWKEWSNHILKYDKLCESNKIIINKAPFSNESKIVNETLNLIPNNSNVFISNSLPIRDFDFFASRTKKNLNIYVNRGASGIDGIISTASGIAIESKNQTFLIIGDLAFYHNLSALSSLNEYKIPLRIILVNNNGGGIFNMLPVAENNQNFDGYFTTSQNLDFSKIVKAFNGKYSKPKSWGRFRKNLVVAINSKNYTVIEIETNSKQSVKVRNMYFSVCENSIRELNATLN